MARIWDRWMELRGRLPRASSAAVLVRWAEAALLLAIAVQGARLLWAIVTPVGMVGDWRAPTPPAMPLAARQALFRSFDPFTRATPDMGTAAVTGLSLQLFGTRVNEASGQGSAIIATPDGVQSSFIVGDAVVPGVTLKEIAYDHVVLDRGGHAETLFLDQSAGAGAPGAAPAAPAGPAEPLTGAVLLRDVGFAPRGDAGHVTGIVVTARGPGFGRAGFQPGDVITQVSGRPVTSMADLAAVQAQMQPGARIALMVERGAATVPVTIALDGAADGGQ